jgi:uncharacterized protein YdhG (YjbR/CyaY superfamily)
MNKLPASALSSVEAYIKAHPTELQANMNKLRAIILKHAPAAEERIAYMMPAYSLNGPLVYFGQMKNHLGFYVMPSGVEAFRDQLEDFGTAKSAIHFPNGKALPAKLIADIMRFRVAENAMKAALKQKK